MGKGGSEGGETQKTEPWSGVKPHLEDLYARADRLTTTPNKDLYSQTPGQRTANVTSMWGVQPGQVAEQYGMTPGQMNTGLATGVAGFNQADARAQNQLQALGASPISGLYGKSQATFGNLMTNPYGAQGAAAAHALQASMNDPFGQAGTNAQSQMQKTASGQYLSPDSNPYLKAMADQATGQSIQQFNTQVLPGLTGQFSSAGRYGSGAQQNVEGQAAQDLMRETQAARNNMYGQAYAQERGLQEQAGQNLGQYAAQRAGAQQAGASQLASMMDAQSRMRANAAQLAPGAANAQTQAQLQRIGMTGQVGEQQRNMANQVLQAAGTNYNAGAQDPYNRLNTYSSVLSGNTGNFGTQTNSGAGGGGGFNAAGAAGGAMGGAMMGSGFGPPGMAVGAIGGGLMGGFM